MMVPGAVVSKLGIGTKVLSNIGKLKYGKEFVTKVDGLSKTLGLSTGAGLIDVGGATVINTLFEAGSEANSIMSTIERKDGETEEQFQLRKGEAGRNVFIANLAILALPNAILNRNILGRLSPNKGLESFAINNGQITNKLKNIPLKKQIADYGKIIRDNTLREGFFEEGLQSSMENYFKENNDFNSDEMFKSYLETLGSVEGQKAVLLGALFGSVAGSVGKGFQDKINKEHLESLSTVMNQGIDLYEKSILGIYKKDDNGKIITDENDKPVVDLGSLSDIANAQTDLQARNEILEHARATGNIELANYLENQLDNEIALSFIKAGDEGIELLKQYLTSSKDLIEDAKINGSDYDSRIQTIIGNAKEMLKENNFYKTYGMANIPTDKENKKYLQEFKGRLQNLYIKNRNDLKYTSSRIKELEGERSKVISDLSDIFGADENELSTNPVIQGIDSSLKKLTELKDALKNDYLNLVSKKYQNEQFKSFIKSKQGFEEMEKDRQKEQQETEKTKETADEEVAVETKLAKEEEAEENIEVVKEKVNTIHKKLDDIYNNLLKIDEAGENIEKGILPGSQKEESLLKGGSATKMADGSLSFIGGVQDPDLLSILPELADAFTVNIKKVKDNDGNDAYKVIADGVEVPLVKQYNVEKKPQPTANDRIDENITNLDLPYDSEINKETTRKIEGAQVTAKTGEKGDIYGKTNKPIIERRHVKIVNSSDTNITSENFTEYRETPRDKTGEKVYFDIGEPGTNKLAEKAIGTYNKIIFESYVPVKDEIEDLIKYLPIRVTFGEEQSGVYTQLFFESDISDKNSLSPMDRKLRESIVDTLVKGDNIDSIYSDIQFQFPGYVQNEDKGSDGKPVENSLLDVKQIDNNVNNVTFFYSNKDGNLFTPLKQPAKEFAGLFVNDKGSIYFKAIGANGKEIPLKLNIRRIIDKEADIILTITEKLLNPDIDIQYRDRINQYPDLVELISNTFKEDMTGLGISINNSTIGDLFSNIIYEGSTRKNWFKITGEYLKYGSQNIKFEEFTAEKENIKEWLLSNKNRNIKVSKLNETAYVQYILSNKILSTDLKLGQEIFKQVTDIYINPNISFVSNKPKTIFKKEVEKPVEDIMKQQKKTKRKGTTYKNILKKLDDLEDGNDSNTIC
jgi:hypothetical protein